MGLVHKSPHSLMRLFAIKSGKYLQIQEQFLYQLVFFQWCEFVLYTAAIPPANQDGVAQIDARAKKRPDSGVTVMAVPKTVEM